MGKQRTLTLDGDKFSINVDLTAGSITFLHKNQMPGLVVTVSDKGFDITPLDGASTVTHKHKGEKS